jgi:hypothetical protein
MVVFENDISWGLGRDLGYAVPVFFENDDQFTHFCEVLASGRFEPRHSCGVSAVVSLGLGPIKSRWRRELRLEPRQQAI